VPGRIEFPSGAHKVDPDEPRAPYQLLRSVSDPVTLRSLIIAGSLSDPAKDGEPKGTEAAELAHVASHRVRVAGWARGRGRSMRGRYRHTNSEFPAVAEGPLLAA